MEPNVNIDEINDIMTGFLDNVVKTAKIHTEWKEKLGEEHEYTKLARSLVTIFNQYQTLYVYIKNPEAYADKLVNISRLALEALSFPPHELMEGNIFAKRRALKKMKPLREEALERLTQAIDELNAIIDQDVKKEEANE